MANAEHEDVGAAQRELGIKLATENDAPKTRAVIEDPGSTYEQILKAAASEVGVERLAPILLQHDPNWAFNALLHVPDLGDFREPLIKKANELILPSPKEAAAAIPEEGLQPVGAMELYLADPIFYEAWFTMFWLSAPNVNQPFAGTPDQSQWKWSIKLSVGINRSWTMYCSEFALPASPLTPGDTVWMNVSISCGHWYQPPFRFRYEPDAGVVRIDASGAPTAPNFAIHQGEAVTQPG